METKAEGWTNFHTSKGDTAKVEAQAGATVYSSQEECAIIKQEVMGEESRSTDYKDEPLPVCFTYKKYKYIFYFDLFIYFE